VKELVTERGKALSMTVYRKDDGPVLNPLKYFSADDLQKLEPYQIFTGEGFVVTVAEEHICDCEYCTHDYDESTRFFRTGDEMEKALADYDEDSVLKKEPCFYARAVRQDYSQV
jgi:hypothetical protein